jgi:hypothetical protein
VGRVDFAGGASTIREFAFERVLVDAFAPSWVEAR